MGTSHSSWWATCFGGGCAQVEDEPATPPRTQKQHPKQQNQKPHPGTPPRSSPPNKKKQQNPSSTSSSSCAGSRLSYTDISTSTLGGDLSSLSSSLLGANLHIFTMAELRTATQGFSAANRLGAGGFGPVYKGFLEAGIRPGLKAQRIAVKLLDLDGLQGHKEWLTEVIMLGQLRHPHLVKLIGYCYEEDHRVLVYEFMEQGSLETHLFNAYISPLPWEKRIKIAYGAAKGLAFLHSVDPPVIYRDFKASNILLDADFKAKLSDFGLAKDGPLGDETHVSTRVMGTHGYAAPEYIMTGHLTAKSDVYSFGVVLLELLTGRRSVDKKRPSREQHLVEWARPCLADPRKLARVLDPRLDGAYSPKGVQKAAHLAYRCLSQLPKSRPHMCDVVQAIEPLLKCDDMPFVGTFVFTVKEEEAAGDRRGTDKKPPHKEEGGMQQNHRHRHSRREQEQHQQQPEAAKVGDAGAVVVNAVPEQRPHEQQQQHRRREHHHHRDGHRHSTRSTTSRPEHHTDTALYRKDTRQHRGKAA